MLFLSPRGPESHQKNRRNPPFFQFLRVKAGRFTYFSDHNHTKQATKRPKTIIRFITQISKRYLNNIIKQFSFLMCYTRATTYKLSRATNNTTNQTQKYFNHRHKTNSNKKTITTTITIHTITKTPNHPFPAPPQHQTIHNIHYAPIIYHYTPPRNTIKKQ